MDSLKYCIIDKKHQRRHYKNLNHSRHFQLQPRMAFENSFWFTEEVKNAAVHHQEEVLFTSVTKARSKSSQWKIHKESIEITKT